MKKIILAVIASLLVTTNAFAEETKAQRNIGAFLGAGFYTSGLAYGVSYKAPITKEFEFSKTWGGQWGYEVVAINSTGSETYFTSTIDYKIFEVAGLATYTWTFAPNQSATVKSGLAYYSLSATYADFAYLSTEASGIGIAYGASYNYDLGPAGIVSLGYYDFSFGVTYAYKF